jgi:hypothetical protein
MREEEHHITCVGDTADSTPPVSLTSEDESRPIATATVTAALAGHVPEDELARTLYDMRNQSLGIMQANIGRRSEVTVKCGEAE